MEGIAPHDFQLTVADPEALAEAIRGSHIDACLLQSNPGLSMIERVHLPHSCFDRAYLSSPMLTSGQMAAECHTLIYVTACPRNGHSFNFSMKHGCGYMGLFAPGGVLDAMTPAGYANATLTIPVDWFQQQISRLSPDIPAAWLRLGHGFRVSESSRRRIDMVLEAREEMRRFDPGGMIDPSARVAFEQELLEAHLDALHENHLQRWNSASVSISRRYGALRRIRDHIASNRTTPIRLDDLCAAGGMSRRGLEYLFKDCLGIGVNAFVRCQRLHGARREIRISDPEPGRVKRIALDWGFWHLGRFAAEYRRMFGENPGDTLKRKSK
jgi:AraC-like DNA-binding protein